LYDPFTGASIAGELPYAFRLSGALASRTALERFNDADGAFAATDYTDHCRLRVHAATAGAERAADNRFGKGNDFAPAAVGTLAISPEIGALAFAECTAQARPAGFRGEHGSVVEVFLLEEASECAFSPAHEISTIPFDQLFEQLTGLCFLNGAGIRDVLLGGQHVQTHFPEEGILLGRMNAPGL
jgi:hypothetical protein